MRGSPIRTRGPASSPRAPPGSQTHRAAALDRSRNQRLQQIGNWLKINGDSIYGTGPTPFGAEAGSFDPKKKDEDGDPLWIPAWDWRCTTKPGKLFIHLFEWPHGKFECNGLKAHVTKVCLLADPKQSPLKFQQDGERLTVSLPSRAPDPIDSVLVLEAARL